MQSETKELINCPVTGLEVEITSIYLAEPSRTCQVTATPLYWHCSLENTCESINQCPLREAYLGIVDNS